MDLSGFDNEIMRTIFVGIVGSVAGYFLPILFKMGRTVIRKFILLKKPVRLNGIYDCKYYIPWKPYGRHVICERIFVFQFGKKWYGFIINKPKDDTFRKLKRPGFRLVGEIFLERYFIGWWNHPMSDDHTYGSFNIQIDPNGQKLEGYWTGESGMYHKILGGAWIWEKQDIRYTILHLIYFRILGNNFFKRENT